jgi:flavin-dependent dehydrogenase
MPSMSKKILEVRFDYEFTGEELAIGAKEYAKLLQQVQGLVWKIFILNNEEKLTGGLYLFENEKAAVGYIEGPVFDQLKSMPGLNNFRIKLFDIMEEQSKITRAPI